MALDALNRIRQQLTRLHDLGLGNAYGELGDSMELIEMLARGDSWEAVKAFCIESDFDGYQTEEEEEED